SYRARLVQANPGDTLRGGMLVTAQVQKERHTNTILVPRTAVFQTETGTNVFTVVDPPSPPAGQGAGSGPAGGGAQARGGQGAGGAARGPGGAAGAPGGPPPPVIKQAKLVPVQLGLQTDTVAEIRSPQVQSGTTIITTRPDALQDKSIVAMSAPQGAGGRGRRGAAQ
ncbi:MAG: hypothetical protein ABR591_03810, partial [Candidatus Velthaea sp.]